MMRRVQVFDVNETLLDLAVMDPHFQRIFGDPGVRVTWFTQMIQSALVATVTGVYHPFGAHAMAALETTADQAGVILSDGDREAVATQMRQLPAHPEVAGALRRLGAAGLRLWTDAPALATVGAALQNQLYLQVQAPDGGRDQRRRAIPSTR
jgi:2-haloacid dehalogenase